MKKIIFLFFMVSVIYAQQVTEPITIIPHEYGCIIQNTDTSNAKSYSYSMITNIGREIVVVDSADTTFNAYRSYFYFNAMALPSNATNISVRVTTVSTYTSGLSFTLKKPATINQTTGATAWDQIRDGVQMMPISISYGTNTTFSSEIQAAFISSFEKGKDFIIGVYNPSDSSEANTMSMFSISLEVTYVRPAILKNFNVDNIPSGGTVNVDIAGYSQTYQCPHSFSAY